MLVLENEGRGPHHTQGLWIGLRKLVVLTLTIHQIQLELFLSFFIPMFSPKANMNLFFIYHIVICMCVLV